MTWGSGAQLAVELLMRRHWCPWLSAMIRQAVAPMWPTARSRVAAEATDDVVGHRNRRSREVVRMDQRSTKIAELLHEAAETRHQVFRITDGADDDWAYWYAEWLVRLSELPELLGTKVVRSELTYLLVRLDKEYTERRMAERWEDYHARELIRHFSST